MGEKADHNGADAGRQAEVVMRTVACLFWLFYFQNEEAEQNEEFENEDCKIL